MRERNLLSLVVVIVIAVFAAIIVAPFQKPAFLLNLAFWQDARARDLQIKQGLDLKGGLQVLLAPDVSEGNTVVTGTLESARTIIENRVNGAGVAEASVQLQGSDRILVELPGVTDRQLAIDLIKRKGQLEFVDGGTNPPAQGTIISTTYSTQQRLLYPQTAAVGKAILTGTQALTSTGTVYNTSFTGEILQSNSRAAAQSGQIVVSFAIKPDAQQYFKEYTSAHIGQALCIVLDSEVLSCPAIRAVLSDGGQISGGFTTEEARNLAITLNYGSLPIPMKIETVRDVGATLGTDSVRRSIIAGVIGLSVLIIFMLAYYRLPGLLSGFSLIFFAIVTLAIFVLLPVTLTLPGIAGFLISVASAVDANILVFERFKEELRGGRTLRGAVEAAFQRAWPSIRDSNLSTLITCLILFIFGNTFGASAVKGFAITLALGILVSLFAAMFVTRTLMRVVFSQAAESLQDNKALLGV
jgi:protein-export membrane protein SecD